MMPRTAVRFAEASLALFSSEGTFSTGVESEEEMELVAQAFEKLGCIVIREPLRHRVKVTPPVVQSAEAKSFTSA